MGVNRFGRNRLAWRGALGSREGNSISTGDSIEQSIEIVSEHRAVTTGQHHLGASNQGAVEGVVTALEGTDGSLDFDSLASGLSLCLLADRPRGGTDGCETRLFDAKGLEIVDVSLAVTSPIVGQQWPAHYERT